MSLVPHIDLESANKLFSGLILVLEKLAHLISDKMRREAEQKIRRSFIRVSDADTYDTERAYGD